jgi:hypothetical protein
MPATGNKVTFSDVVITKMENGEAVELWAQFDAIGLLGHLWISTVPSSLTDMFMPSCTYSKKSSPS